MAPEDVEDVNFCLCFLFDLASLDLASSSRGGSRDDFGTEMKEGDSDLDWFNGKLTKSQTKLKLNTPSLPNACFLSVIIESVVRIFMSDEEGLSNKLDVDWVNRIGEGVLEGTDKRGGGVEMV